MSQPVVLITGGAGRLGRAAARELTQRGWAVRSFDRLPSLIGESIVGSLHDLPLLVEATKDVRAIIHLAATPDDDDFVTQLLPDNIIGLHNILEVSRVGGVKRLLLASSGQVNWWQHQNGPWPIHATDDISPRSWYAVTKVALEAAGKIYAHNFNLTVIAVRLGWCPRTHHHMVELADSDRGPDVYLSSRDAGTFFAAAMERDVAPGYHLVFATSRPQQQTIFDLEPAQQLLGWEPIDRWPELADYDLNA